MVGLKKVLIRIKYTCFNIIFYAILVYKHEKRVAYALYTRKQFNLVFTTFVF